VNKQERTYTVLRDRIHSGAFGPQARLNIDALARELGSHLARWRSPIFEGTSEIQRMLIGRTVTGLEVR
jgi:hypothetical protein